MNKKRTTRRDAGREELVLFDWRVREFSEGSRKLNPINCARAERKRDAENAGI